MRTLLLTCAVVAASSLALAASPDPNASTNSDALSPAEHALFLERVATVAAARTSNREVYAPLEAVPGAANAKPLPTHSPTISSTALDAAERYAAANNSNAFIVWHDGGIERERYFGTSQRDTPIVSRSLSKPIASIAVGRAIALGKIRSVDQPVADFITEWRGTDKATMRLRHLLDMRSGLLAQGNVDDPKTIWTRSFLSPKHERVIIDEYPLSHEPGTRYNYSNATTDLVAIVIERATKRRYAEFLSKEVLQPIGAPGGSLWLNRPNGVAHAGCCMLMPAEVWLRLGILLIDDGVWNGKRLLPAGYVADMHTGTKEYPHAGMGVYVAGDYVQRRGAQNPDHPVKGTLHSEPYLAPDLYLFDGNASQVVYIVPSQRLVILRTGDAPPREPEWDNAYLANTILRGMATSPSTSSR